MDSAPGATPFHGYTPGSAPATLARQIPLQILAELAAVPIAAVWLEVVARLPPAMHGAALSSRAQWLHLPVQLTVQILAAGCLIPLQLLHRSPLRHKALGTAGYTALFTWLSLRGVGTTLAQGDWIRQQSYAPVIPYAVPLVGALGLALVLALWFELESRTPTLGALRVAAAIALASTLGWANVHLFPAQYDAVHIALTGVSAILAQLVAGVLVEKAVAALKPRAALLAGIANAALVLGISGGFLLRPADQPLRELYLRSVRAGYVLRALPSRHRPRLLDSYLTHSKPAPVSLSRVPVTPPEWRLPDDMNVIVIVVDTLRADTLPPAAESSPFRRFKHTDAPFLSRFAAESLRFERTYAQSTVTQESVPAILLSRNPYSSRNRMRSSLAAIMAEHGRVPVAVVPEYFVKKHQLHELLEDFSMVRVYSRLQQNDQREMIDSTLSRVHDAPFFAWFHYYAVHHPGWNGSVISEDMATWPANYKLALTWLDHEIAHLVTKLKALGIFEKTMIVLTADHGESLGDSGYMTHGLAVDEEVTRVPLIMRIPGHSGAVIRGLAGSTDIAPTLTAMLGETPPIAFEGTSLVPRLATPARIETTLRYTQSSKGARIAIVSDTEKLEYEKATGMYLRNFQRDASGTKARALVTKTDAQSPLTRELIRLRPGLFEAELKSRTATARLQARLEKIESTRNSEELDALLRLAARSKARIERERLQRVFQRVERDASRIAILRYLHTINDAALATEVISSYLRQVEGNQARTREFVSSLRTQTPPRINTSDIARRFAAASTASREDWTPWLELVDAWHIGRPPTSRALANILRLRAQNDADAQSLITALRALARLSKIPNDVVTELEVPLISLASDPRAAVSALACEVLGFGTTPESMALLKLKLKEGAMIVRMGAVRGLARRLPGQGAELVALASADPAFENTVIRSLRGRPDERTRKFLTSVSKRKGRSWQSVIAHAALAKKSKSRPRARTAAKPSFP